MAITCTAVPARRSSRCSSSGQPRTATTSTFALGDRFIAYGEWVFKKHTVCYDKLPHYCAEFDVYDRSTDLFLDTPSRAKVLNGVKTVPVSVLWQGTWAKGMRFEDFVKPSLFKTAGWREVLRSQVEQLGFDWDLVWKHTDHI